MKYSMIVGLVLSCLMYSCNFGTSPQIQIEKMSIVYGIETFNGWSGKFTGGVYIDNTGNCYEITYLDFEKSICEQGFRSDSLSSLVISKGVLRTSKVPRDTLSLMDSLLSKAKERSDSVEVFIGPDLSGSGWFAIDPISANNHHNSITLKSTGSWDYYLVSEQAQRLVMMISKYCTK